MKLRNFLKRSILLIIIAILSFLLGLFVYDYLYKKTEEKKSVFLAYSGILMLEDRNYSKALEFFHTSIFLNPNNGIAHQGLARIFYDRGLYDLALIEFEKFIENPGDKLIFKEKSLKNDVILAYCYIADIYKRMQNNTQSQKIYTNALQDHPEITQVLGAYIEFINKKDKKTATDYERIKIYSKCLEDLKIREGHK